MTRHLLTHATAAVCWLALALVALSVGVQMWRHG